MPPRRRSLAEFEATPDKAGREVLTIGSAIGGYNGYTSPDLLSPQFWVATSNVYAGQFGSIRRARWAPFLNSTATGFAANGFRIVSMVSFSDILNNVNWLMFENNDPAGPRWLVQNPLNPYQKFSVTDPSLQAQLLRTTWQISMVQAQPGWGTFSPLPSSLFNGPYSRTGINNAIYEGNGLFRGKVVINGQNSVVNLLSAIPTLEYWGIDAPDVSPQVVLSSGSTSTISTVVRSGNVVTLTTTTPHNLVSGEWIQTSGIADTTFNSAQGTAFQLLTASGTTLTYTQIGTNASSTGGTLTFGITKTIGRSYAYEWENANTGAISAPSPSSQYVQYNNQVGTINLYETGTISTTAGSGTVTGTGTAFTSAWIGKALINTANINSALLSPIITAVAGPTSMTVSNAATMLTTSGGNFQVVDPQVTHVRLYATADAGAVYFLIARNVIGGQFGFSSSGLTFQDNANSEPPNAPFASETTQIYNIPPPIGKFVDQYQGRPIIYGVAGAPQTFFYGNMESTVVGVPAECCAPLNNVTLPIGDGQIFGSANLPTGFLLWSNRQDMFKLTGLLTDNTIANAVQLGATIQRLPYKIGSASPYATAVTSLGAIWLSSDREVWLFTDHYAPKNIGKPVQDVLNRINRLPFAKMTYYKRGERSWLTLACSIDASTFNNKLLVLDLDLLASNGQPSYFTFDMATNAPTWYQYDINCEGVCTSYDQNSTNHLFVGDVDLITDADWQPGYYTIGQEQQVFGGNTKLHALGNEAPEMIKTLEWMRVMTNQMPKYLAAQGWSFSIDSYDDDTTIIGVNSNFKKLTPGVDNNSNVLGLEYSPALFKFGGFNPIKGRRFQIGCNFPNLPGFYELRGYQVSIYNVVGR